MSTSITIKSLSFTPPYNNSKDRIELLCFSRQISNCKEDLKFFMGITLLTASIGAVIGTFGLLAYQGLVLSSAFALPFTIFAGAGGVAAFILFICFSVKGISLYKMLYQDLSEDTPYFEKKMQEAVNEIKGQWKLHQNAIFRNKKKYLKEEGYYLAIANQLDKIIDSSSPPLNVQKCEFKPTPLPIF